MYREGIPRERCSNRERSIIHERAVSCGNRQRGRVCRPQASTTRYFGSHMKTVRQVTKGSAVEAAECQHTEPKLYSFTNFQPV